MVEPSSTCVNPSNTGMVSPAHISPQHSWFTEQSGELRGGKAAPSSAVRAHHTLCIIQWVCGGSGGWRGLLSTMPRHPLWSMASGKQEGLNKERPAFCWLTKKKPPLETRCLELDDERCTTPSAHIQIVYFVRPTVKESKDISLLLHKRDRNS